MATSDFPPTTSSDQLTGLKQAPWESKYHWLCRRKFIEDHKTRYDLKRVISLSMVWANLNFLGCKYSEKVEDLVLYYPVPDQSEIDRWLKVHKDILEDDHQMITTKKRTLNETARDEPLSKQSKVDSPSEESHDLENTSCDPPSNDSIPFEQLTQQLDSLISVIRNKQVKLDKPVDPQSSISENWNQSNNHTHLSESDIPKLAQTCLCLQCVRTDHPVTKLDNLCGKLKQSVNYKFNEDQSDEKTLEVLINGNVITCQTGLNKRDMKKKAAQDILDKIQVYQDLQPKKPVCPARGRSVIDRQELTMSNGHNKKIKEDNKGHQLLCKMGWKGYGGLGGKGQEAPVLIDLQDRGRTGLGGENPSLLSRYDIRSRLKEFVENSQETQLQFPIDLSSDDRRLIHTLSEQYNLNHKSYGNGNERYLIVSKKTEPCTSHN